MVYLTGMFLAGAVPMVEYGFRSQGPILMLSATVAACVFTGIRGGLVTLALSLGVAVVSGWAFVTGVFVERGVHPITSVSAWLSLGGTMLVLGISMVTRQMLAAPDDHFDPTLPGWFARDPPAAFAPLLAEMAADARPESLRHALLVMSEADQRDVLPRITVPTLQIWGEEDVRSPLSVARQFENAIPATRLVVIPDCGHVSNLEQPERVNEVVREFCSAHPPG
jgi:pimeloyl-ACP methyl ester carboxylesterase